MNRFMSSLTDDGLTGHLCNYGVFVWSYTSRMALITVSGSSNWIYSELLRAKICLAFEDRPSHRAWASVVSCSYLRCSGVSGRLPFQVADTVVSGGEHADGPGAE